MHRLEGRILLCGSLLGLLVGCGGVVPGGNGSITGTVSAPASGNVSGTEVIACVGGRPDCERLSVTVDETGGSAAYRIDNLANVSYSIVALKDINGDGDALDIGDYYGVSRSTDGTPELVTPPASGVDIQMMVLTDPVQQLPEAVRKLSGKTP